MRAVWHKGKDAMISPGNQRTICCLAKYKDITAIKAIAELLPGLSGIM
jgi:hypothetical protein